MFRCTSQEIPPPTRLDASDGVVLVYECDNSSTEVQDHFPGNTLLAAYAQLLLVRSAISEALPLSQVQRYSRVKFLSPLCPVQNLWVALFGLAGNHIHFQIGSVTDGEQASPATTGTCLIEQESA